MVMPHFVISIVAAMPVILLDRVIVQAGVMRGRGGEFLVLFILGSIFIAIYGAGVYFCKLFDRTDRDFFFEQLSLFCKK